MNIFNEYHIIIYDWDNIIFAYVTTRYYALKREKRPLTRKLCVKLVLARMWREKIYVYFMGTRMIDHFLVEIWCLILWWWHKLTWTLSYLNHCTMFHSINSTLVTRRYCYSFQTTTCDFHVEGIKKWVPHYSDVTIGVKFITCQQSLTKVVCCIG